MPINDTTFELSVFGPFDTESRIKELRFFYHYPLKRGKRRLPVFEVALRKVNFKHGTRDGKHDDITSRNETLRRTFWQFFWIKDQNNL